MWNLNDPRASHPPHAAANTAVTAATVDVDVYVAISGENIETKLDALSYHYSQVLTLIPLMPMRFLRFPTPSLLQGPAKRERRRGDGAAAGHGALAGAPQIVNLRHLRRRLEVASALRTPVLFVYLSIPIYTP
jgi:hypothetical protein